MIVLGSVLTALIAVLGSVLVSSLKLKADIKGFKMEIMTEIKTLTGHVTILMNDYKKNQNYDQWRSQFTRALDSAKDYFSSDPKLLEFAVFKADKFLNHIMGNLAAGNFRPESSDLVYEQGRVALLECMNKCKESFGVVFTEKYYKQHEKMAQKYAAECRSIMAAAQKCGWNDVERSIFLESLKFMQNFLRLLHDSYYNDWEDLTFYS